MADVTRGVLDTTIDTLVTVIIASTPDLSSTTLNLLDPAIDLPKELHFDWCGASPRRFPASVCSSWHHKDARCRTSM
jgi:hypothetical protein